MKTLWLLLLLMVLRRINGLSVDLEILSKIYLPYTYSPVPDYFPLKDAAEQMTYDKSAQLLYVVGNTNIHVINVSDVTNLEVIYHTSLENDLTDVDICGGFVFVASDNREEREMGYVDVYRTYDADTNTMEHLQHIIVGTLPDMIISTKDCSKLVVALEAEPYDDDDTQSLIDNPGAIVIITFQDTPSDSYSINTLDFTQFDSSIGDLEQSGVRHVYKGNNNPFSNDVEPEFIAFNEEETKAYVTLQENNAIAVVDLASEQIEDIYGLGFKDWSDKLIDVSDRDVGINLRPWSVVGMYQPDSLKIYRHQGVDYVITANEGDSKDYSYFSEEVRVADIGLSDLFESSATVRAALEQDDALGRLKTTTVNGYNVTSGKFDRVYTYGGRSFSIWRASDMSLVYDSGSDMSLKTSQLHPEVFNSNVNLNDIVASTADSRSDDKGPETESIEIGSIDDDLALLFIGNERTGSVAVYSINKRCQDIQPRFHTLLTDIPRIDVTWLNLYEDEAVSMLDAEDMKFIHASDSPNGQHLLLVTGSVSGTVTVVQVNVKSAGVGGDNGGGSGGNGCGRGNRPEAWSNGNHGGGN